MSLPGENVPSSADTIPQYRSIDPSIPIGGIPLAQCLELRQTYDETNLAAGARYDYAWVGLETVLAMPKAPNPQTGKLFKPQEVDGVARQTRGHFKALAGDETAPPGLRARALVALESLALYRETARIRRDAAPSKYHLPYLIGLQTAAKNLLAEAEHPPEDISFLHALTAMALFAECTYNNAWFLPAAPRQPWQITGIRKARSAIVRLVIGNEAPAGVLAIPTTALGDEEWGEASGPFATLTAYTTVRAGFFKHRNTQNAGAMRAFDTISDVLLASLNEKPAAAETAAAVGAVAVAPDTPETTAYDNIRPEAAWYRVQPADVRDMPESTLLIHARNLEMAQRADNLLPGEQHLLGWMQLDHGRLIMIRAGQKAAEAVQARLQATRVSQLEAPRHRDAAEAAAAAADNLRASASTRFDDALASFSAAAKALALERPGEACQVLLDIEAVPVYKMLITGADPNDLEKVIAAYNRRLAALYLKFRDTDRQLSRHVSDQIDDLHAAVLRTTFCLLLTASSDEAARHLALPASLRGGSSRGELDIIVFPIDFTNDAYDTTSPVGVQINVNHKGIVVGKNHVAMSAELLTKKGQMLGLLSKLAAAQRNTKLKARKKDTLDEAIDALALRVADAIADAQS